MRILCVIPSYYPAFKFGGPITAIHGLNKTLVKKGMEVAVYTTDAGLNGKMPLNQEVNIDDVRVSYFAFTRLFEFWSASGWQFSMPMARALGRNVKQFDIVYIVSIWNCPTAIAAHYCRKHRRPYIISPVGLLYPYTFRNKFWKKYLYYHLVARRDLKCASAIHYTAEEEAKQCHPLLGLKNKAAVIYNGLDISAFNNLPDRERLTARYPVLRAKKVILFLGRINWIKGLDILAKAYGAIAREKNDIHLLIVGDDEGGYDKKLKAWLKEEGVLDKATFTGMLTGPDKLEAYAGSDVFILPSYSENFGMAAVEAMACGVPVILTNRVGIYKEVAEKKAGIIIDADAAQLVRAIAILLDNPHNICKEMADNARRLVKDRFNLDRVADEMIELYEETRNAK